MKRIIKHNGYKIVIDKYNSFKVYGDFLHTGTIYTGFDGFIEPSTNGKWLLYINFITNKYTNAEKLYCKSFNKCIIQLKRLINVFLDLSIVFDVDNKISCHFSCKTINVKTKSDLISICNTLKKNNITYTVNNSLRPYKYSIKVFKGIKSCGDDRITIR